MIKQFTALHSTTTNHSTETNKSSGTLSRRTFLRYTATGIALSATISAPLMTAARTSPDQSQTITGNPRKLKFFNTHTGEKLSVTYWANGHYLRDGLNKLNYHLRDHRQDEQTEMDPRLFDQLWLLQENTGSNGTFQVISGYRTPKTNAGLRKKSSGVAKKSYHMQGRAIDARLTDVKLKKLCATATKLKLGGVGYYPGSDFIHLDTGPVRNWSS